MEKHSLPLVIYQRARPLLIFQRKEQRQLMSKPEKTRPGKALKKRVALKELEIEILNYVRQYYLLTPWQVINLRYSPASLTYVQTLLQTLSGNNPKEPIEAYLRRRDLYKQTFGNTVQLYYLGTPAMKRLVELGYPITRRHKRLDKIEALSYPPLIHTLNVNDVLIAGRNLPKAAPDIRLTDWKHDYDLQTTPALVEFERRGSDGSMRLEKIKLVPDGMLDFRLKLAQAEKERRRVLLVEIDRGSETNIEEFKRKIHAYIPFAFPDGAFTELFGKANKRVVWIVTRGGQNRMQTIRKWCEEELIKQGLEHEFNLFRFTMLDQVRRTDTKTGQVKIAEELAIDSYTFFLTPIAYKPFEKEPDTLLWKP